MKKIELTQGKYALVDEDWYEMLKWVKWCLSVRGYAEKTYRVSGGVIANKMHRVIMDVNNPTIKVDHINRNPLDNRVENMRLCSNRENSRNSRPQKNSSSKYKGVCWDKNRNKWMAKIEVDRKTINLGRYDNEKDAAKAYNNSALKHFKEFAYLNDVN